MTILLMSHRFNLVMSGTAGVVWTLGQVITLRFLFEKLSYFEGWGFPELILLLSFGQIFIYSNFVLYFAGLNEFADRLIAGEVDRLLTYPINTKFLISFEKFNVQQTIPLIITIIPLLIYSLTNMSDVHIVPLLMAFVILVIGSVILYFLELALAGLNFFFDNAQSVKEFFIYPIYDFERVPLNIMPKTAQFLFRFIVPIAFVGYYPVLMVKNSVNFFEVIGIEIMILAVIIVCSNLIWKKGLKRYSGVG